MQLYCPICGGQLHALIYGDYGITCGHCDSEFDEGDLLIEDPELDRFYSNVPEAVDF